MSQETFERKEFIERVARQTGFATATVSQALYMHRFKPFERKPGKGRFSNIQRPYYNQQQVKEASELIGRKEHV